MRQFYAQKSNSSFSEQNNCRIAALQGRLDSFDPAVTWFTAALAVSPQKQEILQLLPHVGLWNREFINILPSLLRLESICSHSVHSPQPVDWSCCLLWLCRNISHVHHWQRFWGCRWSRVYLRTLWAVLRAELAVCGPAVGQSDLPASALPDKIAGLPSQLLVDMVANSHTSEHVTWVWMAYGRS